MTTAILIVLGLGLWIVCEYLDEQNKTLREINSRLKQSGFYTHDEAMRKPKWVESSCSNRYTGGTKL